MLKKLGDSTYQDFFAEYDFENIIEMLQKLEKHYAVIRKKIKVKIEDLLEQEKRAEVEKLKALMPQDIYADVIDPIVNLKGEAGDKLEAIRLSVCELVKELTPVTDLNSFYKVASILKKISPCGPGGNGSQKNWSSPDELAKVKEALKFLNSLRKKVEEYKIGEEWIAKEAAKNRKMFFELFLEVHNEYTNKKRDLDVLSYNDIEILTYDLVTTNPQVCDYYKEKYDYIFVDEFQDTNNMQRDVLFAIGKNIFVVGDAKQSIYRFRNADVRVFIETQEKCTGEQLKELKQNRRCLPAIIDAVNTAFPQIFGYSHSLGERKSFEAEYLGFTAVRDNANGCVRLINAPSENEYHNSFNHKLEAKIAFDIISNELKNGKTYKDFALLFRSARHMSDFEALFRNKGVPFVVYGGESRFDLLSSLRSLFSVILNPYDDYRMLEVLKLPVFYTSEQDIYEIKKDKTCIWEGLTIQPIKKFITDMRAKKDHGSFTEFVTEVLKVSKFIPSASLLFTGQDAGAEEAILRAAMHVEAEGQGIEYFLDFIYSMKGQEAGSQVDAVKLMTVHASKGLEFRTVIIPCLDNSPRPAKQTIVISDDGEVAVKLGGEDSNKKFNTVFYHDIKDYEEEADIAESKRLLYVAMTRAMDELYLISDFGKAKGIEGKRWVDWLNAIFNDRVENYTFSEQYQDHVPRIKRVMTVNPELNFAVEQILTPPKRYTVSFIRDQASTKKQTHTIGETGLGSIIHSVLENWDNKEATDEIYQRIGVDATHSVSKIINEFKSSPLGQKIFSAPKTLCEHSFAVKRGSDIVSGRIDRINIYDDHVWVLDFKTAVNEADLTGYKAQIECYVCYAQKAFKGKTVLASIVDVSECKEYKG